MSRMNSYNIGSRIRLSATLTDASSGQAVDPTTAVCRVRKGNGQTVDVTLTKGGVGAYSAEILLDAPGVWTYRFESTGAAEAAEEGVFFVEAASV